MNKINFNSLCMDEIVHDYLNGSTLREVASKFNVSKEAISRVLRESNITLRPSGARKTYTINENFFDIIDTEEKAYVLGLIYSDGSVYKRGNIHCIAIRLQEDDKDLLEKVALAMGTNKLPMYISPRRDRYSTKGQYALDIKNKKLTERLLDMNVKDKDNIPDIPKNLYHHFIRGYFDGDGCISIDKRGGVELYIMASPLMCCDIRNILENEIGVYVSAPKEAKSGMYKIRISGVNNVVDFCQYMYKDASIYLDRKYEKFAVLTQRYRRVRIISEQNRGKLRC